MGRSFMLGNEQIHATKLYKVQSPPLQEHSFQPAKDRKQLYSLYCCLLRKVLHDLGDGQGATLRFGQGKQRQ